MRRPKLIFTAVFSPSFVPLRGNGCGPRNYSLRLFLHQRSTFMSNRNNNYYYFEKNEPHCFGKKNFKKSSKNIIRQRKNLIFFFSVFRRRIFRLGRVGMKRGERLGASYCRCCILQAASCSIGRPVVMWQKLLQVVRHA